MRTVYHLHGNTGQTDLIGTHGHRFVLPELKEGLLRITARGEDMKTHIIECLNITIYNLDITFYNLNLNSVK